MAESITDRPNRTVRLPAELIEMLEGKSFFAHLRSGSESGFELLIATPE